MFSTLSSNTKLLYSNYTGEFVSAMIKTLFTQRSFILLILKTFYHLGLSFNTEHYFDHLLAYNISELSFDLQVCDF